MTNRASGGAFPTAPAESLAGTTKELSPLRLRGFNPGRNGLVGQTDGSAVITTGDDFKPPPHPVVTVHHRALYSLDPTNENIRSGRKVTSQDLVKGLALGAQLTVALLTYFGNRV